jgi:hypothetical protein
MPIDCKIKDSHYKNSRFSTKKEQDLNKFKKENITQDLNEVKSIALNNLEFFSQVLKSKGKIDIPKKDSVLAIRTQSQLNAFSIFLQFIEKYGHIDFLQLQTYTIDEKTIYTLLELLNQGKIKQLQIVMTETAIFRIPKIYKLLKDLFSEKQNVNLCFYWVHSKVHLIKCGNDKYVIDGSGNFSMNAQVEQYNIFHSEKMFDFDFDLSESFFFGDKLRKKHEIYKNF